MNSTRCPAQVLIRRLFCVRTTALGHVFIYISNQISVMFAVFVSVSAAFIQRSYGEIVGLD
jgi:hypothetical protein